MWAGEDEVLRQKIATAREYYKLETEQEIDAEAGPNGKQVYLQNLWKAVSDSRMTEPQQIVCENFVDHLVARGRPFNFKKERVGFVTILPFHFYRTSSLTSLPPMTEKYGLLSRNS